MDAQPEGVRAPGGEVGAGAEDAAVVRAGGRAVQILGRWDDDGETEVIGVARAERLRVDAGEAGERRRGRRRGRWRSRWRWRRGQHDDRHSLHHIGMGRSGHNDASKNERARREVLDS
eukprot:7173560-Prymnesium_polylepis.1